MLKADGEASSRRKRNILYDSSVLQGRPLYDTTSDRIFYVAGPEWSAIDRAVDRSNNTLIAGPRGSGKTTLLRQLQLSLRERDKPAVFVEASAVSEPLELAGLVRDALKGRPAVLSGYGAAAAQVFGDPDPPPGGVSRLLYDLLLGLGQDVEPTVVLLDASGSASAIYGLFGRMRDTIWRLPHRWLVAIDESDRATVLKPPADAFFDTVIVLAPRSQEELAEMLRKRTAELPDGLIDGIADAAGGNPRAAIRAANDAIVHGEDSTDQLVTRARLLEAASRIGRPQAMLMAELLDLGPTSPSDPVLLKRMGLTRARVTTLLHQLQEAGLVAAAVERSSGPGRPRSFYHPVLRAAA